jgi:hypothetical protein
MTSRKDVINNYLADLRYWRDSGRDAWNHYTSGTPYCDTDEEMDDYIRKVETHIKKEKDDER